MLQVLLLWTSLLLGQLQPTATVQYKPPQGLPSNFTKLDVYKKPSLQNAPVVIFLHGGGWDSGDKSHLQQSSMPAYFVSNDFLFLAPNYRLVGTYGTTKITFKQQGADVAAAIKWAKTNCATYGGDPSKIVLFGYSAGGHLAEMTLRDAEYFDTVGLVPADVKACISLDVYYNLPATYALMTQWGYPVTHLESIFGTNLGIWAQASPLQRQPEANVPHLLVYTHDKAKIIPGFELAQWQAAAYAAVIVSEGGEATAVDAEDETHQSLVSDFGTVDDFLTPIVRSFIDAQLE